jgi:MFS family permease
MPNMATDSSDPGRHERGVPREFRLRGYRHTVSWVFYGAWLAVIVDLGPFVIRELGGTASQALIVNLGRALPLIFAVLWVPFVERRNPVRITGLLLGLGGLLLVASGFAGSVASLSTILLASMLLTTVSQPTFGTALQQVYPERWRGKLLSLPNTAARLAEIVCLILVGNLLRRDITLWRFAFTAAGVSLLIAGLVFRHIRGSRGVRIDPDAPVRPVHGRMWDSLRDTVRNSDLLIFLIGYFITTCGSVAIYNVLPLYASDELAIGADQWSYATAGFMVAMLVSFYAWGLVMDRFGAPLTAIVSWILQCSVFAGLYFADRWPLFFALVSARGFFQAGNVLAFFPVVMYFTEARETSRGMGLHFSLWGIRWALMYLFVSQVVDRHLLPMKAVFPLGTAAGLAGIVVMAWVYRRHQRRALDA